MLTQLQLEGPDLETLLARVRTELGSSARIVHAEKIRSGGVAGFFARERFELTVEVDTEAHRAFTAAQAAVAAAAPARPAPAADDAARRAAPDAPARRPAAAPGHGAGTTVRTPLPGVTAPAAPATAAAPAPVAPAATSAPATVPPGRADEHAVATLVPEPDDTLFSTIIGLGSGDGTDRAATGSEERFQALLGGAAPARTSPPASSVLRGAAAAAAASAYRTGTDVALNPAAAVLAAEEAAAGAAAPPPADARTTADGRTTVDGHGSAADTRHAPRTLLELAAEAGSSDSAATVSTESTSFASLLGGLSDAIGADAVAQGTVLDGAAVVVPEQRTEPVEALTRAEPAASGPAAPGPAAPGPAAPPTPAAPSAGTVPVDQAAGTAGTVAVRPPAEVVPVAGADSDDPTAAELARLGLPRHLRPSTVGQQLHTALRASLTRLPTAPPAINRAGGVLAIVGPLALALHVAREIAEELGLPVATSVAVATSAQGVADVPERQVLHGAAEAADRRVTWRRRSNLTVVAVDAPLTATGAAEARAFLAALSPSATWGAVEATRKAQDVATWTRALGGVHALALTDVEDTADPAAVLELGIPVSRLGGRPATPRAWATLLTGRLAA